VQYRVQFLDDSEGVIREMHSYAWSVASVVELLGEIDWPLAAVSLRILDPQGREFIFGRSSVSRDR
jgi:hypothetical protein